MTNLRWSKSLPLFRMPLARPSQRIDFVNPTGLYCSMRRAMFVGVFANGMIVLRKKPTSSGARFSQFTTALSS